MNKFAGIYMQDGAIVPCSKIQTLKKEGLNEPQISDQLGVPIQVVRYVFKNYISYDTPYLELEKRMRENRQETPIQYNLPLGKIHKTPQPRHRENKLKKMWFHGTTMGNFNSIKSGYLHPGIGKFVEKYYGGAYEPEEWEEMVESGDHDAVYLSNWDSLAKSFTAIEAQIEAQIGRKATEKDYMKYGLLIVIEPDADAYKYDEPNNNQASQWDEENQSFSGHKDYSPPFAAETNDIYTRNSIKTYKLIYGKPLIRLYRKLKKLINI